MFYRKSSVVATYLAMALSLCVVSSAFGEDFKALLKKAERGDAEAQYEVSVKYFNEKNYSKTCEWLEKAAAMNNDKALTSLGFMYAEGLGVKQDYKKAREYYEKAAAQNNAYALSNLGRMYENGLGVTADINKAIELYRKAAENGSAQAKKALARLNNPEETKKALARLRESLQAPIKETVSVPNVSTQTQKQVNVPSTNNSGTKFIDNMSIVKPRVAVRGFNDKSEEKNAPVDSIMDMMVTELHKSGAFRLLEREQLDAIAGELKLNQSGLVDPSTALKVGRIAGAQYMITGAVTLYYYSEKASGFALPILGSSSKAKTAYVVLDIRIIDVETSEIVYAANQTGEATNKEKKSIGSSSKMAGGLLGLATRNAVEKHVAAMRVLPLDI